MKLDAVPKRILNSAVYQGSVEHLTLHKLCDVIDEFSRTYDSETDPDNVMSMIQAQPSLLRVLLDTKASDNFQYSARRYLVKQYFGLLPRAIILRRTKANFLRGLALCILQ